MIIIVMIKVANVRIAEIAIVVISLFFGVNKSFFKSKKIHNVNLNWIIKLLNTSQYLNIKYKI